MGHRLHLDFANIFMTGVGWIKSQHLQFQGVVSPPQKNWQFSVKIQPTWVWSNPKRFWQRTVRTRLCGHQTGCFGESLWMIPVVSIKKSENPGICIWIFDGERKFVLLNGPSPATTWDDECIWISYDVYWCLRVSSCQELNIVFFLKLKNDAFSLLGAIRRIPLLALSGLRRRPGKKWLLSDFRGLKKRNEDTQTNIAIHNPPITRKKFISTNLVLIW